MRQENAEIRYAKELKERDYENVIFENQSLYTKLDNLENVFIGAPLSRPNDPMHNTRSQLSQDYATSTVMLENQELRRKIALIENERTDLKRQLQQYTGMNMM